MDRITVVGIGPGEEEYLLPAAREAISAADVLAGAPRHLERFRGTGKGTIPLEGDMETFFNALETRAQRGERIALLLSGDPCFYSLLGRVSRRFSPAAYRVIPGVGSFQLLFSRLGVSWNDVHMASLHGRPLEEAARALQEGRRTLLFLDSSNTASAVCRFLKEAGFPDREAWVAERLGYGDERIEHSSLFTLAEESFEDGLSLLLFEGGPLPDRHKGVLPDDWFLRAPGVPLSKEATRAVAIALLSPLDGLRVLEVGSGTGGLTVELARRTGSGRVVSVERSEEALEVAQRNVQKAGTGDAVRFVPGSAPEALEPLEAAHRVVVGGHGGDVEAILRAAWNKLLPGGRLLVTANMPSTADRAWSGIRRLGATPSLMHINAASGRDRGAGWMLAASNPVFILYADREGCHRDGR